MLWRASHACWTGSAPCVNASSPAFDRSTRSPSPTSSRPAATSGASWRSRARGARVERGRRAGHDRQVNELRAAVSSTLAESDEALAQIVDESNAALSDLQFQDVCAQGLLQLDAWLATMAREIAAELGAAADAAPAAHATVGDEDIQLARRDAGELRLF